MFSVSLKTLKTKKKLNAMQELKNGVSRNNLFVYNYLILKYTLFITPMVKASPIKDTLLSANVYYWFF